MIEQIIQAERLAPSGKNKQPCKFLIYGKAAKRELLSKMEAGIQRELCGKSFLPDSGAGLPDAKNTLRIMKEAPGQRPRKAVDEIMELNFPRSFEFYIMK